MHNYPWARISFVSDRSVSWPDRRGESPSGQGVQEEAMQLKVVLSKTKLRSCLLDIPVSRIPPPSASFQSCGIYAYGE